MKQFLFLITLFFSINSLVAQNVNLIIFNEDQDPFYVYINSVKQNQKAETDVRLVDLTPNISLRIEFENKALPVIRKTMSLEPGFEHTARIKKDKKMQPVLRYFGQRPLAEIQADAVPTVTYHTADDLKDLRTDLPPQSSNTNMNGGTTTNSTTAAPNNNGGSGGVGFIMNVDPTATVNVQTTTSTTVSTTTSTTTTNNSQAETKSYKRKQKDQKTQPGGEHLASDNASTGCKAPMSASSFNKMKESIAAKPFSDNKLSTAKVATKNSCLTVNQIKEVVKLFSMDEEKLIYAKFAYDYCIDKANYYQVSEAFSFSSTTENFNKFLESR